MRILQLSTSWCPPCQTMRRRLDGKEGYEYGEIEEGDKYYELSQELNIKSVPSFYLMEGENVLRQLSIKDVIIFERTNELPTITEGTDDSEE